MRRFHLLPAGLLLLGTACLLGTEPGDIPEADLRVLFVGNSLTYTNDLPRMVAHLATATDRSFAYGVVAEPNFSLEDHWATGIGEVIQAQRADVVVMQQGPSSVGANQQHLAFWAGQLAPVIRAAGGEPALLMVWPEASRITAFDAVHTSYRNAAEAVEGLWIPAGESWRSAWAIDPDLPTYGGDGFHPAPAGSMAAALTTYAVLFDARQVLTDCPFPAYGSITAAQMQVLCAAALDALDAPPPGEGEGPKGTATP